MMLVGEDDSGGSGSSSSITDADNDTKIQVEESSDEDIIRFDSAGEEVAFKCNNEEGDVVPIPILFLK